MSSIHRMNTGRVWEAELAESMIQQRRKVKEIWDTEGMEQAWEYLLDYYQVASPGYFYLIKSNISNEDSKLFHLKQFINRETSLLLEPGSVNVGSEHSMALNEKYPVEYDSVTIFDLNGNPVQSKNPMMIAPLYMIRLEKVGKDWSTTSVPKRQHHGMISKLSATTKTNLPYRNQSIRLAGEAEVRLLMSAMNPLVPTSLLLLANNSDLCKVAINNLLDCDNPILLKEAIDYSRLNDYKSKALDRIEHLMYCYGLGFNYIDERDHTYDEMPDLDIERDDFQQGDDDD